VPPAAPRLFDAFGLPQALDSNVTRIERSKIWEGR
jgi:hypothetical protein